MSMQAPRLDRRNAADVVAKVTGALEARGWKGGEGEAGWALVQLFGRLAELVIQRLNQVPGKQFLAFLNEAGVDLLAPRPASADVTFLAAEEALAEAEYPSGVIRVPPGTQVATQQTETRPEVIFETEEELVVTPSRLVRCITFDPRAYADRTAIARGEEANAFPVFRGDYERERFLFLGDRELLTFADEASRAAATLTLSFQFDTPGDPVADGWNLEWLYWEGTSWQRLADSGAAVSDGTRNFSRDGEVRIRGLPALAEQKVGDETSLWIACRMVGGTARAHLPVLSRVRGSRRIEITTSQTATAVTALSAVQANTSFVSLNLGDEFLPLGQRPERLDTFYLMCDEAFSKPGATVALEVTGLAGVPAEVTSEDLEGLTVVWEYHAAGGWMALGTSTRQAVAPVRLRFDDQTFAFTRTDGDGGAGSITFEVPSAGGPDPVFERTAVNGQEGHWVRARLVAGSYNVPPSVKVTSRLRGSYKFSESKTYAPLIRGLAVTYGGYGSTLEARDVALCCSQVDGMVRDHSASLAARTPVAAFTAREEGPALYLGFEPRFPAGEWIQLLLDVEERPASAEGVAPVTWDYWNGNRWSLLPASDGSQGLTVRGYLGFYAPDDHQPSREFGQSAFWLRASPHQHPPHADAGTDQGVFAEDGKAQVPLDASASQASDGQYITRYHWRHMSSRPPVADAGQDQAVTTPAVTLDASGSLTTAGRSIVRYIWRRVEPEPAPQDGGERPSVASLYLKAVRPNTVAAVNSVTVRDEILGSSNGEPGQVFSLTRAPVHPVSIQIAVLSPDRPPEDELHILQNELRQVDPEARVLLSPPGVSPAWVRWHQVSDFFESTRGSRHFVLDPASGQVRFGDGVRGRIPPGGHNNIKAVTYRTHHGAAGNVEAGSITVLRNPSEDLADIRSVVNPEPAAGGSDVETVDHVRRRGPSTLRHRHRAVTQGGFEWLARDASGEVARTYCLPSRTPRGVLEPGWVTVVVVPHSTAARPVPNPALLRRVRAYLETHALANLVAGKSRVHVQGPEYVEATVRARIVPRDPARADDVKLAINERLSTFLHPLRGGPEREGWELDREVYLSEICAEIEAVPGVDHVTSVRLLGSLRQRTVRLENGHSAPFDLPPGTQVSTFDERVKLVLAEPVFEGQELTSLAVYDFKVGDPASLVAADNAVLVDDLHIAALSGDSITFAEPFEPPADLTRCDALVSSDRRLRLPLVEDGLTCDRLGQASGARVQGLKAGDKVCVIAYGQRDPRLEFLPIARVDPCEDRIFVPEGHLVCSGPHDIEMALE